MDPSKKKIFHGKKLQLSGTPRLDRRNASKNIDYGVAPTDSPVSWSSSSSPSSDLSTSLRASRSLDIMLSTYSNQTSFRIGGSIEGEVDMLYQSLGINGPEDFSIPVAAWEARKARSNSDVLPRSRLIDQVQLGTAPVEELDQGENTSPAGETQLSELPKDDKKEKDEDTTTMHDLYEEAIKAIPLSPRKGEGNGIKGIRPPILSPPMPILTPQMPLAPPPLMRPVAEETTIGSVWDLVPRSRLIDQVQLDTAPVEELDQGENTSPAGETQLPELPKDDEKEEDEDTTTVHDLYEEAIKAIPLSPRKGEGNGIKGIRPPVLSPPMPIIAPQMPLAPPPLMRPVAEETTIGSVWDLISSFAPKEGGEGEKMKFEDSDEEREINAGFESGDLELRLGETWEGFTGTSSLSTVNDDDASSSTTETMLTVSPNGKLKRRIKSWVKGQQLGSGSFGTVYEAISDEGFFFAVKEVFIDQGINAQQSISQLEQEIALLSQFEHENIVQYYGTDKEETKLYIFLELVTQGSLASLYQKYHLRDTHVSAYTRQILYGLVYLHERNIVHRDIKCANILVHANGSVKLADFGLAKEMTKINILKSTKGSVYWMAPEVVNPKKAYGLAADIWSLGCTVLEMLTHQIPYPNVEWTHAFFKIGRGEQPPIPNYLSREARDFITQCVRVNADDRPSAVQLLEHPFVKRPLPLRSSPSSHSSPPRTDPWT